MLLHPRTLKGAAFAAALLTSPTAHAASDPTGIWLDHNGRGAVEISPCADGNGLCGYVVHIKDSANASRCGLQILGNVTPSGGWIYSPERKSKYPVALTRLSDETLRVVGNAGSFFSRTFTWNRAPDTITRCGETAAEAPKPQENSPETKAEAPTAPSVATTEEAPGAPPLLIGASSGAVALLARPRPRIAENEPLPAAPVESLVEPFAATSAEPSSTRANIGATPQAATDATSVAEPERTCKFRIPYVGRVIDVPCRD